MRKQQFNATEINSLISTGSQKGKRMDATANYFQSTGITIPVLRYLCFTR